MTFFATSYDHDFMTFPIDFAYQKPGGKIAKGDNVTPGQYNHYECEPAAR